MHEKGIVSFILVGFIFLTTLGAQTGIGSSTETYYRALALVGVTSEPVLNYRARFASRWAEFVGGPWLDSTGGYNSQKAFAISILEAEQFVSWNSSYPHGGNDGSLWQGVGFNMAMTGGVILEWAGIAVTIAPELTFSQNQSFSIMPSVYPESGGYGYFRSAGMDVYQRPGDTSVFTFGWGDSEIRYRWKFLSVGFGTQQVWIGPGYHNAIILSNNASPFPKIDFGVEKVATPLGFFEGRAFVGLLEESDYFDSDETNDSTIFSLISISWGPSFAPGLTLGFHRSIISKNSSEFSNDFAKLFGGMNSLFGSDEADQRASVTIRYLFAEVGFEAYAEWAKNDYSPNLDFFLRYPFHAQGYVLGARKAFVPSSLAAGLLVVGVEIASTESSRDYELLGSYSFYGHHIVSQGYTNQGQILGAEIGTGGNGQYLDADYYLPEGKIGVHLQRVNRDNDYVYFLDFGKTGAEKKADETKFNTELTFGIDGIYLIGKFQIGAELAYIRNLNPKYNSDGSQSSILNNMRVGMSVCWVAR